MEVKSYFEDFLEEIRLTDSQVEELKKAHIDVREKLKNFEGLKDIIVNTFLQGSYRRYTAVKPEENSKADVDVVIVTNLNKDINSPENVFNKFIPFLDTYYENRYKKQGRSICIEFNKIKLDLVPTSAPNEQQINLLRNFSTIDFNYIATDSKDNIFFNEEFSKRWKNEPLYIPDREAKIWDKTHPLKQIEWTSKKNSDTNKLYVNVVKALKWWKREKCAHIKYPKSYPLEHFIGFCCPNNITSIAEGVKVVLENIVSNHKAKPFLPDHGVPEHDVFARITTKEYEQFYKKVQEAANIAKEAFESNDIIYSVTKWRELFGNKFPKAEDKNNNSNSFSERKEKSINIPKSRFA
ncbi:MAG: nucleotidyltransferase [Elusimicrobia bacterium]|nr:nucleotidyltransferase [Elusimicrobiota bacterium]